MDTILKIKFKHRISGLARTAYATKEVEVLSYRILRYGDIYESSIGEPQIVRCNLALRYKTKNGRLGVFELKPGSRVIEI